MDKSRYIAVEGPIGVGKTSLARRLAETFNGRLMLEEPADNPMLVDFYKDRVKNAFKTQLFFLLSRYQQQKELIQQDLFKPVVISDYLFAKDRIFASINLAREEQSLYEKVYQLFDVQLPKPDLVLYLHANTDVLVKNIKKRGHDYEKGIDADYIEQVAEEYNQFFFSYTETPLLVVNCSQIDFIKNQNDYENLVREIMNTKKGQHQYVAVGGR